MLIDTKSGKEMKEIEVQNEMLPIHDIVLKLLTKVKIVNLTRSQTFLVQISPDVVVGVTFFQPESRTLSTPNVIMRIVTSRIGTGHLYREASDAQNMEIGEAESFDPDEIDSEIVQRSLIRMDLSVFLYSDMPARS